MTSRAVLLPVRGDPFSLMLNMELFKTVWRDEVSMVHILMNSLVEEEVPLFLEKRFWKDPKIRFSHIKENLDHGPALTQLYKTSTEDNIVLLEDDFLIYQKGILESKFAQIENGSCDMLGSPRWSCDPYLEQAIRHHFNTTSEGNFWPCFLFVKRSDLARTDLHFGATIFKFGEYVPLLDWTVQEGQASDTFVWASIQLRALGLRIVNIPQHRESDGGEATAEWGYSHNGTLSSAIDAIFTDDREVPLSIRKMPNAHTYETRLEADKGEIERRVSWNLLAVNQFWNEAEEISEFRDLYKKGIMKYVKKFGLFGGQESGAEARANQRRKEIGLPEVGS